MEDSVKWALHDTCFSAEEYVQQLCADLGLDAAWYPALHAETQRQLEQAMVRGQAVPRLSCL